MKKKVLISITTLFGGGAERVVSVWASQLVNCGYDVSVLLYGRSEAEYPIDKRVRILTVAPTYEEYKQIGYFNRLKIMRKLVKQVAPDVLINFLPRMQIWMMMATFGLRMKRVETVRVSPWNIGARGGELFLWKLCFKRAHATIVQTPQQAEYFDSRIRSRSVVIPNPISAQYRDNPKKDYAQSVVNFVAAGRVTPQKNYPAMIRAVKLAREQGAGIQLSIYGTGNEGYIKTIQALIDENDLSDSVRLMGRTSDMLSALHSADAFLMTSNFEGMPNALAEAMAVGLPCISTDCRTGPRDLIDDGVNGFLVQVGEVEDIAAAIVKLARINGEQAKEIGQEARKKVLTFCSEANSLEKLRKLIDE